MMGNSSILGRFSGWVVSFRPEDEPRHLTLQEGFEWHATAELSGARNQA